MIEDSLLAAFHKVETIPVKNFTLTDTTPHVAIAIILGSVFLILLILYISKIIKYNSLNKEYKSEVKRFQENKKNLIEMADKNSNEISERNQNLFAENERLKEEMEVMRKKIPVPKPPKPPTIEELREEMQTGKIVRLKVTERGNWIRVEVYEKDSITYAKEVNPYLGEGLLETIHYALATKGMDIFLFPDKEMAAKVKTLKEKK